MKRRSLLRFFLCVLCAVSWQPLVVNGQRGVETVERVVTGEGRNQDEAVVAALREAARQIFGLTIATDEIRESYSVEVTDSTSSSFDSKDTLRARTLLETPAGVITGYSLEQRRTTPDGQRIEVTLRVQAAKFTSATGGGSEQRLRLAILPPRLEAATFRDGAAANDAVSVGAQWNQALVTAFVQSRRFAVLDREYMDELAKEHGLLSSGGAALTEQVRLGQLLGADFILVGTLADAARTESTLRIALTGEMTRRQEAHLHAQYRIIDVATAEIRSADSLLMRWDNSTLNSKVAGAGGQHWLALLLNEAAGEIAARTLDIIYPIRIIRVTSAQQIILNQGGSGLQPGQQFEVFLPGEVLIDPYTGESLGAEEIFCGVIQVTRVQPKFSVARLVSGDFAAFEEGGICRRPLNAVPTSPVQPERAPAATQPAPGRFTFPGGR